jgi:N-carbamoyl-L-amino-acid hydrolase
MRINAERLQASLLEMARIGATPGGGVSRVALTDADREGRDLFARWAREAGLELSVDEMGSMFGRRRGKDPALSPVLFGSHLDSVPQGGRFDGTLGVLAALEVVRTLNDQGIETAHPLEIVNFTNEEGARFQPAMLASGVMAGTFSLEFAYAREDRAGLRFGDELARIGYRGRIPCAPRPIHAYVEYHIEQGPVLERDGLAVGAVIGILGIAWARVTIEGERDHAGPTPMPMRRDALVAAARVVTAVRDLALRFGGDMVTTVGCLDVEPNVINVIPGKVVLTVDIRDSAEETIEKAVRAIEEEIARIAEGEGVRARLETIWRIPPTHFSPEVIGAVEEACRALGYPYRTLMAGAGHDAKYMNDITRTGMIFIRTKNGKSHCEEESAIWEDVEQGANVLLHTVLKLAS